MNGKYALDTNIVIALIDGEIAVRERVVQAEQVFIPAPVLGELFFGAYHSRRVAENVSRIDKLTSWYPIMMVDDATAKIYGLIRSQLRAQGTPIPTNDIWTAALAKQYGATVASRDRHFDTVEGVLAERW
jgi:tRNA(fMet)-specific endonuclease VapC